MKRHLRRKVEEYNAGLIEMEVVTTTLKSYLGMLDHCDCKEFRKELIDSVVLDRNKVIGEIAYEVENYSEAMVCGFMTSCFILTENQTKVLTRYTMIWMS